MFLQRFVFFLSIQLLIPAYLFCQAPSANLLAKFNSSGISLEEKALTAAEIADKFRGFDDDSAKYYAVYGLDISLKHKIPEGIFRNSCLLGKLALAHDSIQAAIGII
jgi:hypothetical protein